MSSEKTTGDEDTISVPLPEVENYEEEQPQAPSQEEILEQVEIDMADMRAAMESVGRALTVAMTEYERLSKLVLGEEDTVVHACPPNGSGLMPCCGRSPIDVPLTERISLDGTTVTCKGIPIPLPPS